MAGYGTARAWVRWFLSKIRVPKPSSLSPGVFFSRQRLHVFWGFFLVLFLLCTLDWLKANSRSACLKSWRCARKNGVPALYPSAHSSPARRGGTKSFQPSCFALPFLVLSCPAKRKAESLHEFLPSTEYQPPECGKPAAFLNRAAAAREKSEGGRLMPFSLCLPTYSCPWQPPP